MATTPRKPRTIIQRMSALEKRVTAIEKGRIVGRKNNEARLDKIEATLQGIRRVIETARPTPPARRNS